MGNTAAKQQSATGRPKKNVHWKTAEIPSAPGKPVLVHTDETDADVVTLRWERPRTDGGSPLYGYYVQHRRTGSPQWVNSTPALILYPEVVLTGLEPGWRYQFRVTAENAVGTSEYSELSDPLTVSLQRVVAASAAAPQFVDELPLETTVIEMDKVEFRVTFAGAPMPQVNWFKDGFEVFSSRRTKIVTENSASTLIIHQTALTDEGEIKCTATNRLGHVVARGALRIEAPPKIRLPRQYEDGLLIEADEVVRLKVGLAGRPPPMVVWCHNGEIIRNDAAGGHYEVLTNEKNSTLKIAHSRRSDRGEYNLRAINKLGDDVVSFLVTVTDRPSRPGKVTVTMSLGKSVTLSWQAPDDDGGCKIGNYVVEYFRLGWNVWLKAVTTRQLSATLNDLIEGSEYKFRVKAESPYGMSDPSEESDVMFVPDPKRGILNAASSPTRELMEVASEQASRIPVLSKTAATASAPLKTVAPKTAAEARAERKVAALAESVSKSKTTLQTNQTATSNNVKRVPSPKLYDSETLAREMRYGTSNSTKLQPETSQSMVIGDTQLPQQRKNSLKRDIQAAMVPERERSPKPEPAAAEVHSSSEFVMVLHDNVGITTKYSQSEQPSSTLDPEFDSIPPPPLSHSTPELGHEHPVEPKIRRCVSSTEMLYEKAMQRFYKAVELEAGTKTPTTDRRSVDPGQPQHPSAQHDLPVVKRRLGSFGEADLLERRNSLRKRVSTESLTLPAKLRDRQFEPETKAETSVTVAESSLDTQSVISEDRDLKQEILESQRRLSEQNEQFTPTSSVEYEEDYTESTASSESITSIDSMEKFKSVIRSISKDRSSELDTYNPMMSSRTVAASSNVRTIDDSTIERKSSLSAIDRNDVPQFDPFDSEEMIRRSLESTEPEELLSEEEMEEARPPAATIPHSPDDQRALSPYRTPAPDQSTIALTRPLPLPSPDFVPKPILKRPSIEETPPETKTKTKKEKHDKSEKSSKSEKSEKSDKSDKSDKSEKPEKRKGGGLLQMFKKSTPSSADKTEAATSIASTSAVGALVDATATKMSAAALAKKKSMERRQSSLEENKVAIDHYSDIVNTISVTRKPKVPVYLSADELKKGAERDAAAAREAFQTSRDSSTGNLSTQSSVSSSQKHSPKPPLKRESSTEVRAAAAAAATLKESTKRSLFATKLSKDPKKLALEALPKPTMEFSRSVSADEEPAGSSATPRTSIDSGGATGEVTATKRGSLQRGRTPSSDSTATGQGKTRTASATRSRSSSVVRKGGPASRDSSIARPPRDPADAPAAARPASGASRSGSRTRTPSRTRQQSQSKSPTGRKRTSLHVARIGIARDESARQSPDRPASRSLTPEQLLDEAEKNVRSSMAYVMDVSLLVVASWLYVFKNVWLVLPILALLVYRQVSSAVADKIPKWMKRKRSQKDGEEEEEQEAPEDEE